MEESYAETRFVASEDITWPSEFAIVSAHATTGEHWTDKENDRADEALRNILSGHGKWLARVICSPSSSSLKEPSWACDLPFEVACDLGMTFRQEALFWVGKDSLFVSYCDERRALRSIGRFRERLDRY